MHNTINNGIVYNTLRRINIYNYKCTQCNQLCQLYVMKFVSDFLQVGGFNPVHWFPQPLKLTATI